MSDRSKRLYLESTKFDEQRALLDGVAANLGAASIVSGLIDRANEEGDEKLIAWLEAFEVELWEKLAIVQPEYFGVKH